MGVKRVLVVERDTLLRALIGEWLAAGGMQAVYPDAQGLAVLPPDIDAVVIDVASPRQAHSVLECWRRAYPKAAIIAVSGRFSAAETASAAMACRLGVTKVLAKPFRCSELWAALSHPGDRPSNPFPRPN
jgi:DNA-binding response OmpR family regulator